MNRGPFSTSNYLYCDSTPVVTAPLTIAAWVWLTGDITGLEYVFSICDNSGTHHFALRVATDETATFATSTSGFPPAVVAWAASPCAIGTWEHIAGVTANPTSRYAYRNGLPGEENTGNKTPTGIDSLAIGVRYNSTILAGDAQVHIGHVGLWNIALSTAQIQQLAAGELPPRVQRSNLVSYWECCRSSGGEIDAIGGYDLSEAGAVSLNAGGPALRWPEYNKLGPAASIAVAKRRWR